MLSLSKALKILSIVCILAVFQNCAPQQSSENGAKAPSEGQIQVHPGSGKDDQVYLITPKQLEFSLRPSGSDEQTYLFYYSLDVATGVVTSLLDDRSILILSEVEQAELRSMFEKTMIANSKDFLPEDIQCAAVIVPPYARMVSEHATFDLGYGTSSCSIVDLYWLNTSQVVPLKDFLEQIEGRLPQ